MQFRRPERIGTTEYGPVAAAGAAFDDIWFVTDETQKALRRVVVGEDRENLTTPVGIVDQSTDFIDAGVYPRLLALISLSLAIFNLLPFLPLDGGHILFALIEKVRAQARAARGLRAGLGRSASRRCCCCSWSA